MKYYTFFLAIIIPVSTSVLATPETGDRDFSISGSGTSDQDFNNNTFSFSGQLGYFYSPQLEVSGRQTLSISELENFEDSWNGATRIVVDYHFHSNEFVPFIGASLGAVYGDEVDDTASAGLELGAKYYVKPKTYITGLIDYQFLFESGDEFTDNFDDGAVFYSLGVGFNF